MSTDLFGESRLAGDAPRGLGRAMAGGGEKTARRASDYYPTPPEVTRALVAQEQHCLRSVTQFGKLPIWEPCGRGGAIAAVLEQAGFSTVATDLVADPEHRVKQRDLLQVRRALSPVAITNPPFALAGRMIEHLIGELATDYCALLLKATFWHAANRTGLFRRFRPQRIWALNWRPDFLGLAAPVMEVVWCVWDRRCQGSGTRYDVLSPSMEALDLFALGRPS